MRGHTQSVSSTFPSIGNLDDVDARRALAEPAQAKGVTYEDGALDVALEVTGGYPYSPQELGYAVWAVTDASPVTADHVDEAVELYEAKLDSSFFRVRLDRTSDLQQAYLRAMAALGPEPQKAADVAARLDRESTQPGPTARRAHRHGTAVHAAARLCGLHRSALRPVHAESGAAARRPAAEA